jgi:hypothetical protein
MPSYKQKVLAKAQELGVEVQQGRGEVVMEAPGRMVFGATGTHGVVASVWDDETMVDQWKKSLADLKYGLDECSQSECDICEGF